MRSERFHHFRTPALDNRKQGLDERIERVAVLFVGRFQQKFSVAILDPVLGEGFSDDLLARAAQQLLYVYIKRNAHVGMGLVRQEPAGSVLLENFESFFHGTDARAQQGERNGPPA